MANEDPLGLAVESDGRTVTLPEHVRKLRTLYLRTGPRDLTGGAVPDKDGVYGVVGEYVDPDVGYVMVMGLIDGRSRFLTPGPTALGGDVPHDAATAKAAVNLVESVASARGAFTGNQGLWSPQVGQARFTLLTLDGRRTFDTTLEIRSREDPSQASVEEAFWQLSRALTDRMDFQEHVSAGGAPEEFVPAADTAESVWEEARQMLDEGRHRDAEFRLGLLVEAKPEDPRLYHLRGIARTGLGRQQAALESFDESIRLDPEVPGVHANRGWALLLLERPREGLAAFKTAHRLGSTDCTVRSGMGNALYRLGRYEDSAAAYREALACDPEVASFYGELGRSLATGGDYEGAIGPLEEALRRVPEDVIYRYLLALTFANVGRDDEALAQIDRALFLEPQWRELHELRSDLLATLGRHAEAAEAAARAKAATPMGQ